ncbi:hypothetical protein [Streptomyces sp. NPDC088812]|uniref:hypothetical protein n=1 Tax=Streptomyces sp. NPDC088812 TaxID=3365905 RepID=UPI00380F6D57
MPVPTPEQRALLAEARLRRRGWTVFEAGARRAALRVIRARLDGTDPPSFRPTTTG